MRITKRHHVIYTCEVAKQLELFNEDGKEKDSYYFQQLPSLESLGKTAAAGLDKPRGVDYMSMHSPGRVVGVGAFVGDECVGYAWGLLKGGVCREYKIGNSDLYICRCLVHPEHRGHGLLTRMVKVLVRQYCIDGVAVCAIDPDNTPSRRSFEKVGFAAGDVVEFTRLRVRSINLVIPKRTL